MTRPIHIVGLGGSLRPNSTSWWALERALDAAEAAGATVDRIRVLDLNLPFYEPRKPLDAFDPAVRDFIERVRAADGLLLSSPGYHGILAGVTKNALDFLEFLSDETPAYLNQRVVGVISTASGEQAAVRTADSLVHVVHALRGTVVPLQVAIPQAGQAFVNGEIQVSKWADRLDQLGSLVVEMAGRWSVVRSQ